MKINFRLIASVALLGAVVTLAGCRKGDPGPAGQTGNVGTNGAGYDDAIKKGNIVLYLSGQTPDGTAFKDTVNFKYSAGNVYRSYYYEEGDNGAYFDVTRYLAFDNPDSDDAIDVNLSYDATDPQDTLFYMYTNLLTFVKLDDHTSFTINDTYYVSEGSNVDSFEMLGFSHDPTSGALKSRMTYSVSGENNNTGFDLDVTVVLDCIVYENYDD